MSIKEIKSKLNVIKLSLLLNDLKNVKSRIKKRQKPSLRDSLEKRRFKENCVVVKGTKKKGRIAKVLVVRHANGVRVINGFTFDAVMAELRSTRSS